MRTEWLPGMTNVLRFPVELRARPTLQLLWEIAPDVREVLALADAFDLEMPVHNLRDLVDADTAGHIVNQIPDVDPARRAMLDGLLQPHLAAALAACRQAHDAALDVSEIMRVLTQAKTGGHAWLDPLQERAEALALRMVEAMVAAHTRAEEASGVARAVGLARCGETWTPRNANADMEALLAVRQAG